VVLRMVQCVAKLIIRSLGWHSTTCYYSSRQCGVVHSKKFKFHTSSNMAAKIFIFVDVDGYNIVGLVKLKYFFVVLVSYF
jgi:hypothetical protein